MVQFDIMISIDESYSPREINWAWGWKTLCQLRGIVRRMPLTKADRKRLNAELDLLEDGFGRLLERAIEEYPIKMESLLERLGSVIERVKTEEVPARYAWLVVREVNWFFQNNQISCPARDEGILRLKAMVQELKVFQHER